ncbi:aspartate--tRNA ligase [Cyclobacteriaceae bacterium]|nr:aspartate--tRNA ligase [Cyclobacteriaceae bacterium]MDB4314787.1 aspartate--tRNA ligase [Cyclobacteriaceae bacterium]MDB4742198.1 aspartate--tRNA ligase [Cyclobacteriaceae bacterium]
MLRTNNCGELREAHLGHEVTICGWVQRIRDKGGRAWIDLRDRYGMTQLMFEEGSTPEALMASVRILGREYVIRVKGRVIERLSKNPKLPTGDIEIQVHHLEILNEAAVPPFLIEDETDGGDELRMKYRYLDLRRAPVRKNLELRHQVSRKTRAYLDDQEFIEVETPYLIKSTPEGARDFIVPSRMNPGQFYALPQSPQTFKQLLMVSGLDRYYQIVKCFRDEDLRADRQPEFTQIDCEMSFVEQEDILEMFEGLVTFLFKEIKQIDLTKFPRITYADALRYYGSDKPDLRFEMRFVELNEVIEVTDFPLFNAAELVVGINAKDCATYSRKELDELVNFVRKPQVGATGLIYVKYNLDGSFKSSVDKFFDQDALSTWAKSFEAKPGDLMLILAGKKEQTRKALNDLRLEMGDRLELRPNDKICPAWVIDFPLLEWDEETQRYHAMHHPFTSPKSEYMDQVDTTPESIKASAYDMVINGVEIGGGSIRIHKRALQSKMFDALGFTKEEAEAQFGFLLGAFEYGAPPHGGIAFGLDRLCSLFGGAESIRDFIAFPKNSSGRDVMIDSPSLLDEEQLSTLGIQIEKN